MCERLLAAAAPLALCQVSLIFAMTEPFAKIPWLASWLANMKGRFRETGPELEPPWGIEPQTYALRVRRSGRLS